MLMSADMPLPDLIYSHGFLTKDGLKMGKSLGECQKRPNVTSKETYYVDKRALLMRPTRTMYSHGFLTKDGLKMGKSLGKCQKRPNT